MNDWLPIRPEYRGEAPYGAPQLDVPIALNTNENPHSVPDVVQQSILDRIGKVLPYLNRYPDRDSVELRDKLAEYINAKVMNAAQLMSTGNAVPLAQPFTGNNLWAANGSNEILQQILQAFGGPGRTVLSFAPTYSMYPLLARGTFTTWIAGCTDERFALTAEEAVRQIREHRPDVVLCCSPNNPTGRSFSPEIIAAIAHAAPGLVVVDEAYAEFSEQPSAIRLIEQNPRVVVSRTMSKAFAFAGARLGYVIAHPDVVDALQLVRLPYHLSALTQAAALAALDHSDVMLSKVQDVIKQRKLITQELPKLGLDIIPSDANFVLFTGMENPDHVWKSLVERGVLVRDVGLPGWLRVTAGTERETHTFLESLTGVLREFQL